METDYLKLKEQCGKSWNDLHLETGIPLTTLRDYVSGKVADPKPRILSALDAALLPQGIPQAVPQIPQAPQDIPQGVEMVPASTLAATRELYERQLASTVELYESQIASLKAQLAKAEARIRRLTIALAVCVIFFTLLMAFDILNRGTGWFRGPLFFVLGGVLP